MLAVCWWFRICSDCQSAFIKKYCEIIIVNTLFTSHNRLLRGVHLFINTSGETRMLEVSLSEQRLYLYINMYHLYTNFAQYHSRKNTKNNVKTVQNAKILKKCGKIHYIFEINNINADQRIANNTSKPPEYSLCVTLCSTPNGCI